jgi:hypothetical protein
VDAALIPLGALLLYRVGVGPTGRHEVAGREGKAFRGRHRLTRKGVEVGDDAAAELLDFGEGVDLAAAVDGEQLLADPGVESRWGEVPGAALVVPAQQGEELREIDAALAGAGAGADGGVEGLGTRLRTTSKLDRSGVEVLRRKSGFGSH